MRPTKFVVVEFHKNVPAKELINDVIAVSKKLGKNTVTIQNYLEHGKFHPNTLKNRFKSWTAVLKKAGLKLSWHPMDSDELLFRNIKAVWMKLGTQPRYEQMKAPLSKYSSATYLRRFGTWKEALRSFVDYQNSKCRGSAKVERKTRPGKAKTGKCKKQIKRTSRDVSLKLRLRVLVRDGFRCKLCGRSPLTHPGVDLQCDHIRPWSKGGETTLDNLWTLCCDCNLAKGNKMTAK